MGYDSDIRGKEYIHVKEKVLPPILLDASLLNIKDALMTCKTRTILFINVL